MEKTISPVSHRLRDADPVVGRRPDVIPGATYTSHRAQNERSASLPVRGALTALAGLGVIAGAGATMESMEKPRQNYTMTMDNPGANNSFLDSGKITLATVNKDLDPARHDAKLNDFNFMGKLSDHLTPGQDNLFPGSKAWIDKLPENPGELATLIANTTIIDLKNKAEKPAPDDIAGINGLRDKLIADGDYHTDLAKQARDKLNDRNVTKTEDEGEVVAGVHTYKTYQISPVAKDSNKWGDISRAVVSETGKYYSLTIGGERVMVFDNCGQFGGDIKKIEYAPVQKQVVYREEQAPMQTLIQTRPVVVQPEAQAPAAPEAPAPQAPAPAPPAAPSTWTITLPNIPTINIPLPPNVNIPPVVITPPPAVEIPRLDFKLPQQDIWANPQLPVPQQRGGVIMPQGEYQAPNTVVTPAPTYTGPSFSAPNNIPAPNSNPSGLFGGGQAPAAPGVNGSNPNSVLSGIIPE